MLLALSAPVLLILGPPYLVGAGREVRQGRPSVDSLIAVGALAGFGVSAVHVIQGRGHVYFDTATMLLVLVTLGKLLEASAKMRVMRPEVLQLGPAGAPSRRLVNEGNGAVCPAWRPRLAFGLAVRTADGTVV
jgi:Cu2+-exporting ATPase